MESWLLDDLTGARTRAHLAPALEALARNRQETAEHYALAVIDVDHLKSLNDVYGHATGDAALRAVAERTLKGLRGNDQLFRFGGDEFVVLLPDTNRAEAEAILRRVHDQVTSNPVEGAVWVSISASVGVAATDEDDDRDLFERADERVRLAKRSGRSSVMAHDRSEQQHSKTLQEVRLEGRDAHLAAATAFLAATGANVLRVNAAPGAGVTRFLAEVAVRARQAGRVVRQLTAQETRRGLHLWALGAVYTGDVEGEPVEHDLRTLLRNDADAHGLVVLLTGGDRLDPGSAELLAERLQQGGTQVVEVVMDGAGGAFAADQQVVLDPLTPAQVGAWLSAALGGPLAREVAEELAASGGGLPGPTSRLTLKLVEDGVLKRRGGAWSADVGAVKRSIAGVLEQRSRPPVVLPTWERPLVGRRAWLEAAAAVVRERQLVVLVGAGGTGKSRLAAQLALELAHAQDGGADDGTYWVDLRNLSSAASLPGLVAEALGFDRVDDVDALVERLGARRVRVVLDNADAGAEQAGVLTGLLRRAPGLRLLVTARMPLRLERERVLVVPELSAEAARELFRQGMQRVGAAEDVDDDELDEVLTRVGREPLALELAAAWTRILALHELIEQLDRQPESLMAVPGSQPLTTRFIEVARQLMSAEEQEALGTLALIRGGFRAEEGRAASSASPFFLLALLERSLLRREGERYTVHESVAERFRDALLDAPAANGRVARAYSDLARQLNELPVHERSEHGFKVADAERANLEVALRWLASSGDGPALWHLVKFMRGYLDVRGRARQGLELFRAVDAAISEHADLELRAWVRESVGLFHWQRGENKAAAARVAEALELLAALGPNETHALALNTAGIVAGSVGGDDGDSAALAHFAASASMRAELGDHLGEAQARGNMALVLASKQRHEEAFAALQEARANYAAVKHYSGLALTLASLAQVATKGELLPPGGALDLARECVSLSERIGYAYGARLGAANMGDILTDSGRSAEAAAAYERASHWARIEDRPELESAFLRKMEEALSAAEAKYARDPQGAVYSL